MTLTSISPTGRSLGKRPLRPQRSAVLAIAIVVCALAVRLLFAWPALTGERDFQGDEPDYYGRAISLLQEGSFSVDGRPTARRLPVFPAMLVTIYAVDSRPFAAIPAVLGLSVAICGGVYLLGRQLFDRSTAWLAAFLSAFDLNLAWYGGYLLSETLFVLLTLLGLVALVEARRRDRLRWLVGAGLLCGLALLTRVQFLPLIGVVVGWTALAWGRSRRRALVAALILTVTIGAVWAPWGIRNALVFGRFMPSTSQPCPPCVGLYRDEAFDLSDLSHFAQWQATPSPPELSELEAGRYRLELARTWVREHPAQAAIIAALQAPLFWRPTGLGLGLLAPLAWLAYLLLLLASARGLVRSYSPRQPELVLWVAVAVALTIFSLVTIGEPRHRLVLHPLLNVLAAGAIVDWRRQRARFAQVPAAV